jgi:hypothetical protein
MPVCDHLHLQAEHNYNLLTKHVRWQILPKIMTHERLQRVYDQQRRPASTIPRDILPIMEVKRNNSTNYIHIQLTIQLYIHIPIINKNQQSSNA